MILLDQRSLVISDHCWPAATSRQDATAALNGSSLAWEDVKQENQRTGEVLLFLFLLSGLALTRDAVERIIAASRRRQNRRTGEQKIIVAPVL